VERQNLTMRMGMRRFTRLTNGFSMKVENLEHAVSPHFMHYNFARIHQTLRVTPAMEAGISDPRLDAGRNCRARLAERQRTLMCRSMADEECHVNDISSYEPAIRRSVETVVSRHDDDRAAGPLSSVLPFQNERKLVTSSWLSAVESARPARAHVWQLETLRYQFLQCAALRARIHQHL
jgi:hypothetical protein